MRSFIYIFFIVIVVLYVLNPLDIIPDLLPIYGWIDDTLLIGLLLYFLRKGSLQRFLFNLKNILFSLKKNRGEYGSYQGRAYGSYEDGKNKKERKKTSSKKTPYDILGVKSGSSQEEIQAAYRKAVHAYHPDKVSHLGPELRDLAKKKFVEIQEAYQELTNKK